MPESMPGAFVCPADPYAIELESSDARMIDRLRQLWKGRTSSVETERERLCRMYPNHLELIDSREIPSEYRTGSDLSYFTESAEFYYHLIVESSPHLKDKARAVTDADREMASIAYNRIVSAIWGLIARGPESIPFAVELVRSKDRDHREAAANVFSGMRDPDHLLEILPHVHAILESERDQLVLDSLLSALGQLRSRESISVLSRFIRDSTVDRDTRNTAATSLGQIVKRRFDKDGADAVSNALIWLDKNGHDA